MVEFPPEQTGMGNAPFNMALASLQRLHFLRVDASDARRSRSVNDWIMILDSELSEMRSMVKLKDPEMVLINKARGKFWAVAKAHSGNRSCYMTGREGKGNVRTCTHDNQAFFILSDYEMVLSDVQFAHKLSMPGSDDPRQAFKGGGM